MHKVELICIFVVQNKIMEYEVRATNYPNFLMASGFYGEQGKIKAQGMIDNCYWTKIIMPEYKDAIFEVFEKK